MWIIASPLWFWAENMGIISRNWKIDTRDRFGLLLVACWYSIGNVNKRFEMLIEERVEII